MNQPADFVWKTQGNRSWEATFKISEAGYWVYLDGRDGNEVGLVFSDAHGSEEVTGGGNAFQVFATIAVILRDYLAHRNPTSISFTAKGASRTKLYQRLADQIAREVGGHVRTFTSSGCNGFEIILDQDDDEDLDEERIDELLNKPLEWEWTRHRDHGSIATFHTDKDRFDVALSKGDGYMDVMFISKNHGLDISGDGQSFQIFATVAAILKDFISSNPPQPIRFSAKEPSRAKLYQRLAQMMAKELGWKADSQETSTGRQFYVEPYEDLKEDGKIIPNVNTTVDVQPGETERQAIKFGNALDAKGRPPLLRGSYGDDSARFSANQGDPFYGSDGTRLPKNKKWS